MGKWRNGRSVDKEEWAHVPWSEQFVDIEGPARRPREFPSTRFKMMFDDEHLFIAAEMEEPRIWGTLTQRNSTLYHENDFEVFLDPDGSRHNYYEMEINCLNTVWELLLHRPYKDGYSIENPYNLASLRTSVFVDGVTNSPADECRQWSVEVSVALEELVQFDRRRQRPAEPGDVWRVNFSRVQYELQVVLNDDTQQLQYEKVPDKKEDNIVWAPTGVIDIHRPEKWGVVFFSSQDDFVLGEQELETARLAFLDEQLAIERVLDAIYYDQRVFHETHEAYAGSMSILYSKSKALPHAELFKAFDMQLPRITSHSELDKSNNGSVAASSRHRRSYVAQLDVDDEDEDGGASAEEHLLSPRTSEIRQREAQGLFKSYFATLKGATQEWNISHDGRLWMTPCQPPVDDEDEDAENQ